MRRLGVLLALLAMSLALCAPAAAQLGPLPPAPTPPSPAPPGPTTPVDEGLSTLQQLLIFGAAGVLIGVIAWVIVRDARRSSPGAQRSQPVEGKPSARERERERRRRRGKARAARQQRKRNRRS